MGTKRVVVVVMVSTLLVACGEPAGTDDVMISGGVDSFMGGSTAAEGGTTDEDPDSGSTSSTTAPPPTTGSTMGSTTIPDPDSSDGPPPPPPAECDPAPVGGAEPLIDDLEPVDGGEPDAEIPAVDGRLGFWFTYNDGTPGGTQEPGTPFVPAAGGANGSAFSAGTSGDGFTDWGAGMGVSLNNDYSGDCPYDGTAYTGVGFWMQGGGSVRMHISTQGTVPPDAGGTCNAPAGMCHDDYGVDLMASATWSYHEVRWAELAQQGWGAATTFETSELLQLHWQVPPGAPFDVMVDEVAFLTD